MSFLKYNFFAPTAVHPLLQAYFYCDIASKENDVALENLFQIMEKSPDLHLFVTEQESFFLEDVNDLIGEYHANVTSHYSMRLSRIVYNVAEKLQAMNGRYAIEGKSYRDWAPKVEHSPVVT